MVIGAVCGIVVVLCMSFPFTQTPGYIYDLRIIPYVIAIVYGGLTSGTIAALILLSYRYMLGGEGFDLQDDGWPVLTSGPQLMPARVAAGATVEDSLVCAGAVVGGTVLHSVVGPGTVVEPGAVVKDSVLLHGVQVAAGAELDRVIADDGTVVGRDAKAGGGTVTILGQDSRVAAGVVVAAGTELEPDGRAE